MNDTLFVQLVDLAGGLALVSSFVVLWRRGVIAMVRALAAQGAAIAMLALVIGVHDHETELVIWAVLFAVLKVVIVPAVVLRVTRENAATREAEPLVNVTASLVVGALLTLVAYATTRHLVSLTSATETKAIPIGVAIVLIGFFAMTTRQVAVTQVVGFLSVDNGIAMVGFLATGGVPLVVELGAALDLLLVVLILQVLAARMRNKFGGLDLDQMRELHD